MKRLASVQGFIIDMDGVLYRGDRPLAGAREFIQVLQAGETPFLLLTNNSTRTPAQYVAKLQRMGIHVDEEVILTSAQATAMYLERVAPPGARVYVIGEEGLQSEIARRGFAMAEEDVAFVVVGMDTRLTYDKLRIATLAIRHGAKFIGTNPDRTFPAEEGIVPGCGAILAAVEVATDVKPLVIGKPQRAIFDLALARMGTDRGATAVLGDRLETDILGGQEAGLMTILVLSGVTTRRDLERSPVAPDLVFEDIEHLRAAWQAIWGST
ncbi:MAG: HAD-IIA family hydrolase [Anaerolineae bacterium]